MRDDDGATFWESMHGHGLFRGPQGLTVDAEELALDEKGGRIEANEIDDEPRLRPIFSPFIPPAHLNPEKVCEPQRERKRGEIKKKGVETLGALGR